MSIKLLHPTLISPKRLICALVAFLAIIHVVIVLPALTSTLSYGTVTSSATKTSSTRTSAKASSSAAVGKSTGEGSFRNDQLVENHENDVDGLGLDATSDATVDSSDEPLESSFRAEKTEFVESAISTQASVEDSFQYDADEINANNTSSTQEDGIISISIQDSTVIGNQYENEPSEKRANLAQETVIAGTVKNMGYNDGNEINGGQSSILIIHYHKTGFVLARQLRKFAIQSLESIINEESTPVNENSNRTSNISKLHFQMPNSNAWGSIHQPRKHNSKTMCPPTYPLDGGVIHIQESPDFFCGVEELKRILLPVSAEGNGLNNERQYDVQIHGRNIIHFVRNPYEMALSNYYYHAQDPTPEPWAQNDNHNPCQIEYHHSQTTMADVFFPYLSSNSKHSSHTFHSKLLPLFPTTTPILSQDNFNSIVQLCQSLYQSTPSLQHETFDVHLQQLDPYEGLQLATAQMMIRGGGRIHWPGGDILRMANNLLKLKELENVIVSEAGDGLNSSGVVDPPFTLVTVSMDDYISNPVEFTKTFLNFLLGGTKEKQQSILGQDQVNNMAKQWEEKYNLFKKRDNSHFTQGKNDDREQMRERLKKDPLFGPILDRVEVLVNEALA